MTTTYRPTRSLQIISGLAALAVMVLAVPPGARAAGVVGSGAPASCTAAALIAALSGGGLVTFNCGGAATVDISGVVGSMTIAADTTIDGGSLITISGGNVVQLAAAFYVAMGKKLTLRNLTIADRVTVQDAGAITNDGGTVTINDSTLSGNGSATGLGAITNLGGALTVTNSTFSGNNAGDDDAGGAISNQGGGTVAIANTTFSSNDAGGAGGALANFSGTTTVTNSTFSGNSAGNFGGALANYSGTTTVTNSTFSGNDAPSGGGAIVAFDGTVIVINTIIANSLSGGNCIEGDGTITDGGHNLQFPGATCGATIAAADPMLDPAGLADNGGPTQTLALCTGAGAPAACAAASPAIDAGDQTVCAQPSGTAPVNNLDQRGYLRPGVGAANCSIGAFEADALGVPVQSATGRGLITVAASGAGGCSNLLGLNAVTAESLGSDAGFLYPFGLVGFRLNCAGSSTVTLTFLGGDGVTLMSYRKFGPLAPAFAGPSMFYALTSAPPHNLMLGTTTIPGIGTVPTARFTLTDNQSGDGSGTVGLIVDPGGPALAGAAAQVPAASPMGLAVMMLTLCAVAARGLVTWNTQRGR